MNNSLINCLISRFEKSKYLTPQSRLWKTYCLFFILIKYCLNWRCKNSQFREELNKLRADQIFIIGSGPSIEEIDPRRLAYIKKNTSIGINSAATKFNSFDAYAFEFGTDVKWNSKIIENLNLSQKSFGSALFYYHTNLINRRCLGKLTYHEYSYVRPPIRQLEKLFLATKFLQEILDCWNCFLVVGRKSTLERIISLAIRLRPKEIILCGIDLGAPNSANYHPTLKSTVTGENIIDMLQNFYRIAQEKDVQILSGSDSSPINSFFPKFKWPEQ